MLKDLWAILALATMLGCGGEGLVRVLLTDEPLTGATAVNVTIARVEAQVAGAEARGDGAFVVITDHEQRFNLLALQDGLTAELGEADVPEGRITHLRLQVAAEPAPELVNDSGTHPMTIPSGFESGIKVVGCFGITAGETTEVIVDFDAGLSVTEEQGGYVLRPVIKIANPGSCLAGSPPAGVGIP